MMKPARRLFRPIAFLQSQSYRKSRESHRLYSDRMNTNSSVRDTSTGNMHSRQPVEREAMRDIYRPSKTRHRSERTVSTKRSTNLIVFSCRCCCVRFFVDIPILRDQTEPRLIGETLERRWTNVSRSKGDLLRCSTLSALSTTRWECQWRYWCEPLCSCHYRRGRGGQCSFGRYGRTHCEPRDPREICVFARIECLNRDRSSVSSSRFFTDHF